MIDGNRLIVLKCIVEALPDQPFSIMIATTSKALINLSKNIKVAEHGKAHSNIVSVQGKQTVDLNYTVPIYKVKQDNELQFGQRQQVLKIDKINKRTIGKLS